MQRPILTVLACIWFAVPLGAAAALVCSVLLPRAGAGGAVRAFGALIVLAVLAVLVAVHSTGLDVALLGPLLALAGGIALVALPAGSRSRIRRRRSGVPSTGVPS